MARGDEKRRRAAAASTGSADGTSTSASASSIRVGTRLQQRLERLKPVGAGADRQQQRRRAVLLRTLQVEIGRGGGELAHARGVAGAGGHVQRALTLCVRGTNLRSWQCQQPPECFRVASPACLAQGSSVMLRHMSLVAALLLAVLAILDSEQTG